ncbi:unnamed protein product, partial [Didymodactylos carnosus]
ATKAAYHLNDYSVLPYISRINEAKRQLRVDVHSGKVMKQRHDDDDVNDDEKEVLSNNDDGRVFDASSFVNNTTFDNEDDTVFIHGDNSYNSNEKNDETDVDD